MNELITQQNQLTMSSLEIAELVEKRHDNVKRTIESLINKKVIQVPQIEDREFINGLGLANKASSYIFSGDKGKRDSIVVVAQLSPEFTARLVDRWQELESKLTPQLPTNYLEALKALVASEEEKALIALERDHAIETKAEIGSRREATAMAKASAAVRKVNKLQKELDQSKQYFSIKRMTMLCHGIDFNWRLLKSTSLEMGLEPIDVFDQNYGTVKAYHVDVWKEAYAIEVQQNREFH